VCLLASLLGVLLESVGLCECARKGRAHVDGLCSCPLFRAPCRYTKTSYERYFRELDWARGELMRKYPGFVQQGKEPLVYVATDEVEFLATVSVRLHVRTRLNGGQPSGNKMGSARHGLVGTTGHVRGGAGGQPLAASGLDSDSVVVDGSLQASLHASPMAPPRPGARVVLSPSPPPPPPAMLQVVLRYPGLVRWWADSPRSGSGSTTGVHLQTGVFSPFLLGETVVIDMLIMAHANYLVKGRSSVSEASLAFNPSLPYSLLLNETEVYRSAIDSTVSIKLDPTASKAPQLFSGGHTSFRRARRV
jgi:hypothetical protein